MRWTLQDGYVICELERGAENRAKEWPQSTGSVVVSLGAQLLGGMWDLPGSGIELVSLSLQGDFLITGPLETQVSNTLDSVCFYYYYYYLFFFQGKCKRFKCLQLDKSSNPYYWMVATRQVEGRSLIFTVCGPTKQGFLNWDQGEVMKAFVSLWSPTCG